MNIRKGITICAIAAALYMGGCGTKNTATTIAPEPKQDIGEELREDYNRVGEGSVPDISRFEEQQDIAETEAVFDYFRRCTKIDPRHPSEVEEYLKTNTLLKTTDPEKGKVYIMNQNDLRKN